MEIIKDYDENELILSIKGRIDVMTSENLENEINSEIDNFNSLILDFDGVEYISSAGLRVLVATEKKLKSKNIPFTIKNVNDAISEIFRMSGFDRILNVE